MGKRLLLSLALAVVALAATSTTTGASSPGFKTARPAQLVPWTPGNGVVIDPILSTGDIVGGYQMSGIPDGLGAYKTGTATVQVFMNHELEPSVAPNSYSRISHLTIDRKTRSVLSADYAFTGAEGYSRFCSSTLEVINGTPWYFTGEEDVPTLGHDGSSIAMNAETEEWVDTKHFGHVLHENVVPMERLSKAFFLTTDDDFRDPPAFNAYLYSYIANTWEGAIAGTEGSLYVWKADGTADSSNDIAKGQTLSGHFVPITQAENASGPALEAASLAKGGFKFSRLEDAAAAQQHPGRAYFADTGKLGSETIKGRIYQIDIDPSDPTKASVTLLLDGDGSDDLINPDNLDASTEAVVIQEDRNSEHRGPLGTVLGRPNDPGYGRVLVYDIKSGSLKPVARPNTTPPLRPGEWESSGVINAQTFLGEGWWLMDIQAHRQLAPQPGVSLLPNSSIGEDGQLLAVYIPNT
jgi:hypothetical protein